MLKNKITIPLDKIDLKKGHFFIAHTMFVDLFTMQKIHCQHRNPKNNYFSYCIDVCLQTFTRAEVYLLVCAGAATSALLTSRIFFLKRNIYRCMSC